MKLYSLLLFSFLSSGVFSQTELLDSVRNVQLKKDFEHGKSLCTPGYWNADSDGGINGFKQISSWPEEVMLKLFEKRKNENRAVLTLDIYHKGNPEDRIYMYLLKESGTWLIDGINETEGLTEHFLEAYYSGHFTPFDLPKDAETEAFGEKIISFGRDHEALLAYLRKNTAEASSFDFISELTEETDLEPYFLNSCGFDERMNKGYINFWANSGDPNNDHYGNITIYISKTENGTFKILGQGLFGPSINDFFSINQI